MNKELFGVFGGRASFERLRSSEEFDRVVDGPTITLGVRDPGLDVPNRTHVDARGDACCVVWGEAFLPGHESDPASWLLDTYPERGRDALGALNGSFLAVVDHGDGGFVASDPLRTRECFYTDAAGSRVFGTDPVAVASQVDAPTASRQSLLEFVHMGVVLGDDTVFEEVRRVPFDGYVDADSAGEFSRFVYDHGGDGSGDHDDPADFDYAESLARRLERAIARRSDQPGRTGVLLSAGYDSRLLLSELDVDRSFTVGEPDSDEVAVSRKLAAQYDVPHRVLAPEDGYLNTDIDTVQYGQFVKESLQIHHAIDDAHMDVDSVHHGLLFDTLLSGHFRPRDGIDVLGHTLPKRGLDPDPDVAESLLFDNFGFWRLDDLLEPSDRAIPEDSTAFCRRAIEEQRDRLSERYDATCDAIPLIGIQNQPTLPFHAHLADNFFASFVAADAELVEWHLRTPAEHRNSRTYRRALERLDADLLRHSPPDRPHDSYRLNQIEKFLRRFVPGVQPFETAWPDRAEYYGRTDLDRRLFGDAPALHDLPPRLKLRANDVTTWAESIDGPRLDGVDAVSPPPELEQ